MILSCIKFIDYYPADISQQISEDLALRKMFCEFTGATALLTLARSEDNVEAQLQNYLELRKHVDKFDEILEQKVETMESVSAVDLLQKLSVLLTFDFEAACHLKAWDSLGEIILKAAVCKSMRIYQLMADCLLCTQAPTAGLSFKYFSLPPFNSRHLTAHSELKLMLNSQDYHHEKDNQRSVEP